MSELYLGLRTLHILSATILFGTGLGTAFFMAMAHRGGDPRSIATVARIVVIADFRFTAPAAVVQPASGIALAWLGGIDPLASWLVAAYLLYALAGACWLPVLRLQIRIRDLARDAVAADRPLPPAYRRCMAIWFALGWPAFLAFLAIFWLMVAKPDFW
jgi:uncharacterized membrane protein